MITPFPSSANQTFTTQICIVDADADFRDGALSHLEANGLHAQGHADAAGFFRSLRSRRPACVVLDMGLPDMDGLEAQRTLVNQYANIPLIFVASAATVPMVTEAIRMGASDFVLKPLDPDALLEKIRTAVAEAGRLGVREMRKENMRRRLQTLTAREHHILSLALTGKSNKEISQLVGISHRTVETHRAHILQKIGVGNLLELAHIFADLRPFVSDDREVYEPDDDKVYALGGLG